MSGRQTSIMYEDEWVQIALGHDQVALRAATVHRIASFAPYHGGLCAARSVVIHQVNNADLPPDVDPVLLLASRMQERDSDDVGMLTSRSVAAAQIATSRHSQGSARALVTLGLSNAVRVGDAPGPLDGWGTINIVCHVDVPLSDEALLEALSIVAEARTCAMVEANVASRRGGGMATGTGTDCIAVLAPLHGHKAAYAGKHTVTGHVIGDATQRVVAAAIVSWKQENLR